MLYLAEHSGRRPVFLREISGSLNLPHHFLGKILQTLTREGIVVSRRGKSGGYALGRDPEEISVIEIIRAVDGESFLDQCMIGFSRCSDVNPCPAHATWKKSKENILFMLYNKSVAEFSRGLDIKISRIEQMAKPSLAAG